MITIFANSVNFNPRSPRGERQGQVSSLFLASIFQSTLSARRATNSGVFILCFHARFQSTLSARRATLVCTTFTSVLYYFNPRSPRGERLSFGRFAKCRFRYFNPRSPRGERPCGLTFCAVEGINFNPRSPRGERQPLTSTWIYNKKVDKYDKIEDRKRRNKKCLQKIRNTPRNISKQ